MKVLALSCALSCLSSLFFLDMNNNCAINILAWNVRGINSQGKWDAIRAKIDESAASIVCLQEIKRESFEQLI